MVMKNLGKARWMIQYGRWSLLRIPAAATLVRSCSSSFSKILHSVGDIKDAYLKYSCFFDKKYKLEYYFSCLEAGQERELMYRTYG